ncbi:MAG: hypothetical protein ACLFUJ_15295 [Phycisphaerae bacterium]
MRRSAASAATILSLLCQTALAAETFTIETSSFLGWAGAIRTDARGKDASFAILAGAKTDAD